MFLAMWRSDCGQKYVVDEMVPDHGRCTLHVHDLVRDHAVDVDGDNRRVLLADVVRRFRTRLCPLRRVTIPAPNASQPNPSLVDVDEPYAWYTVDAMRWAQYIVRINEGLICAIRLLLQYLARVPHQRQRAG